MSNTHSTPQSFLSFLSKNLILQICIGIVLGIFVGYFSKDIAQSVSILGDIFIKTLKSIAPILVFFLVISAIANRDETKRSGNIRSILILYLAGTFLAALTAVTISFIMPVTLDLPPYTISDSPKSTLDVLYTLLFNIVDNPLNAIINANYMGILAWGIIFGFGFHRASAPTKAVMQDISDVVITVIRWIIRIAPYGIFGIVAKTIAVEGIAGLEPHLRLIVSLLTAMGIVAFVVNPLLIFTKTRNNPYPIVLKCLKESGTMAFFTRSSAANIPVNLDLCKRMGLDETTYSVAVPLGAAINMSGAAVTITIMTLAAAHTLNIEVTFVTALLLSLLASVAACGVSGVAGGSLLLIPLACSLFNIPADIAASVVGAAFVISVIQDSAETAINSATDVMFIAACDEKYRHKTFRTLN